MTVVGEGALAEALRRVDMLSAADVAVLIPPVHARPKPFVELEDDEFAAIWELPMRWAIAALQDAHRDGVARVVIVVPTIALTGGREYAHVAAVSEALRATAKSAARQWGARGMTVNTVAVSPELFGVDVEIAGPMSIAPAALAAPGSLATSSVVAAIAAMITGPAQFVTGQTLVADGGTVMP
ncbi:MAG: SDR family oxidoreductase [Acidimicrobiia bacterium]